MNLSKKNKLFLLVIATYFIANTVIHFARLTFSWPIIVGETEISTVVSGACILFSISVTFFIIRFLKKSRKEDCQKKDEKEEVEDIN